MRYEHTDPTVNILIARHSMFSPAPTCEYTAVGQIWSRGRWTYRFFWYRNGVEVNPTDRQYLHFDCDALAWGFETQSSIVLGADGENWVSCCTIAKRPPVKPRGAVNTKLRR